MIIVRPIKQSPDKSVSVQKTPVAEKINVSVILKDSLTHTHTLELVSKQMVARYSFDKKWVCVSATERENE